MGANGGQIPEEDLERAATLVDAAAEGQAGLFVATLGNVRAVGGDVALTNVVSVLAQSVVDLRRELAAQRPEVSAPRVGDGVGLRVRDVDVQRLSDLVSVVSDSSLLSEEEAARAFDLVFEDALGDPYGPPGRLWAMRALLNLSVALLAREATVRAARDEVDAMEALRAALDEILRGEV